MSTAIMTSDGDGNPALMLWKNIQQHVVKAWVYTKTGSVNAKEIALIKKIEFDIESRKRKFGVDYLTLKLDKQTEEATLKACMNEAVVDIEAMKKLIAEHEATIDSNNNDMRTKIEG